MGLQISIDIHAIEQDFDHLSPCTRHAPSLPATLANQITQLVTTAAAVSTCPVIVDAALMPVLPW